MKKLLIVAAAMALTSAAMAMTLQAAKGQIPGAVANPAKMAEIMKELSEDDQIEFLALVNAAIGELNASADEKAALYLAVNEAALKAHGEGNLQSLLATTFATVPPESLTVLNEQLAKDLFNRNADPTRPISDGDFAALAKEAMEAIATRASDTDDAAARTAFAVMMFVRASEGSPADLRESLAETISDPAARELALSDWIPAALGEQGAEPSYDPILGAVDAEVSAPDSENVSAIAAEAAATSSADSDVDTALTIANSQDIVPLLADLGANYGEFMESSALNVSNPGLPDLVQTQTSAAPTTPSVPAEGAPWNPETKRGETTEPVEPTPQPQPPEPQPYPYQGF